MASLVGISPTEAQAICDQLRHHSETMLQAELRIRQNAEELAMVNYISATSTTLLGKYEAENSPKLTAALNRALDAVAGTEKVIAVQMAHQDEGAADVQKA